MDKPLCMVHSFLGGVEEGDGLVPLHPVPRLRTRRPGRTRGRGARREMAFQQCPVPLVAAPTPRADAKLVKATKRTPKSGARNPWDPKSFGGRL